MRINRFLFIGLWATLLGLLFVFPGLGARGLGVGLIVGYLPFHCFPPFQKIAQFSTLLMLLIMFILSGSYVVGISWFMDKEKVFNRYLLAVFISLICISGVFFMFLNFLSLDKSYQSWLYTQDVHIMRHTPTKSEFYRIVVIPRTIAGCQLGVYAGLLLGGIYAARISFRRKRFEKKGCPVKAAG